MQAMLTAFLQMNTKNTGIQSVQADQIGRIYPPLFMINLSKEEEIIDDIREITTCKVLFLYSFCLCKLLETGFLVPALFGSRLHLLSEGCALVWGMFVRGCARRDLC